MTRSILSIALVAAVPLRAQAPASASGWTSFTVQSAKLGEKRTIYVATPAQYVARSRQRYPVLVLLDAEDTAQFEAAVANAKFLASRSVIPPIIVVGVTNGKDREHDLTPTATGSTLKEIPTAGGAATFTSFLADEVLPAIRIRFRALPTTVLAGHSVGGLLALHAAAVRSDAFVGFIAISPSLWWNVGPSIIFRSDRQTPYAPVTAVAYADSVAGTPHAIRLFAATGDEWPIETTTGAFAAHLDSLAPQSVAFAYRHYPDESHLTTPARGLADGLRFVFQPVCVLCIDAPQKDWFAVLKTKFGAGARSLGMPESLPELYVDEIARSGLATGAPQAIREAVQMLRDNAAAYPDSPKAWDSLGDALLAAGDTAGAIAPFHEALAAAKRTGQGANPETRKKLASIQRFAVR